MRIRTVAVAAALAALAAGCGKDSCPTEAPEVRKVASCTAPPAQRIDYPIALCPTCNQTLSSCDVQMSGNSIFLNPVVESCTSSSSCGAACSANANACTFTVPSSGGPYNVSAYDAAHPDTPQTGTLTLGGSLDCTSVL